MNKYERLSLTLCVAVAVFLPKAFGLDYCYQCTTTSPTGSPPNCEHSDVCPSDQTERCIAVTAKLMNGTMIGYKSCFPNNATCDNVTVCERARNKMNVTEQFKNCSATCCNDTFNNCNTDFPVLPTTLTTTPTTEAHKEGSGDAGIKIKALCYLPIFLLVIIQMMI